MDIVEIIKIILLGIIEGVTEWLPVSSTGHMYLFDEFWPIQASDAFKEMFFVVIQLGAILAVVVMFWNKLWPLGLKKNRKPGADGSERPLHAVQPLAQQEAELRRMARKGEFIPSDQDTLSAARNGDGAPAVTDASGSGNKGVYFKKDILLMWLKVIIACIPTAILGFLLDDILDTYLYNGPVIAAMLIVYGIAFILIENWNKKRTPRINSVGDIGYMTAVMFGLFQALAMIPGTSRSGATIVGALLIGVSRTTAAEFTFFLAIPTMFGASLLKLVKFFLDGNMLGGTEIAALFIGMAVAFAVSLAVIRFLMNFVRKHDFKVFGWYRIALGIVVGIVFALQFAHVIE